MREVPRQDHSPQRQGDFEATRVQIPGCVVVTELWSMSFDHERHRECLGNGRGNESGANRDLMNLSTWSAAAQQPAAHGGAPSFAPLGKARRG